MSVHVCVCARAHACVCYINMDVLNVCIRMYIYHLFVCMSSLKCIATQYTHNYTIMYCDLTDCSIRVYKITVVHTVYPKIRFHGFHGLELKKGGCFLLNYFCYLLKSVATAY